MNPRRFSKVLKFRKMLNVVVLCITFFPTEKIIFSLLLKSLTFFSLWSVSLSVLSVEQSG